MTENPTQVDDNRKSKIGLAIIMSFALSLCCGFSWSFVSFGALGIIDMAIIALGGITAGLVWSLFVYYYKVPGWPSIFASFYALTIGSTLAILTAILFPFRTYSPHIFAGYIMFFSLAVGCIGAWVYTTTRRLNLRDLQTPQ